MRIVLVASGTRGDVRPLISLGKALCADGHDVLVGAPANFEPFVTAHGLPFRKVGEDSEQMLVRTGGRLREALRAAEAILDEQFVELEEVARGAQLLVGAGTVAAGASLAEAWGIPYRYIAYCPLMVRSHSHPPMLFPWRAPPRWVNALGWWLNDKVWEWSAGGVVRRHRKRLGLGPIESAFEHAVTAEPLVAADPLLAPLPPELAGRLAQPGQLQLEDDEPLPEEVEAFLAAGGPPVYIGFGSMVDMQAERTTRLVVEAVEAAGTRALLSSGWAGLGRAALPPSIRVIGPVSHARLFPRVSAVVHHGGAGTTHSAARAGQPQVVVPHLVDQFYWGHRVHALGLGPEPIRRARLTAASLTAALRACAADPGMRERARALAARLITDGPRRAARALLGGRGPAV